MNQLIPKRCCVECHYLKDTRDGGSGYCILVSEEDEVGRKFLREDIINGTLQNTTRGGISRSYGCYKGIWINNWIQEINKKRRWRLHNCFFYYMADRQMSEAVEIQRAEEEICKSRIQIAILIVAAFTFILTAITFLKGCSL